MIQLYDPERDVPLGEISDEQLQLLMELLEEESAADRDYFIGPDTVDMLEDEGADPAVVAMLRQAVGEGEGVDVRWEQV